MRYKHSGQAMTETAIAASLILLPLFLLIPLLGKYIDIQHSTIQAARYEAWEYTVWYSDNSVRSATNLNAEKPKGVKYKNGSNIPLPTKNIINLQKESRQRFYSETAYKPCADSPPCDSRLFDNDYTKWDPATTNSLWRTHRSDPANPTKTLPILSAASINSVAVPSANTPSTLVSDLIKYTLEAFKKLSQIIQSLINFVGQGTSAPVFDAANTNGYSKSEITVTVPRPRGILDFGTTTGTFQSGLTPAPATDLAFTFKAAVLSDGWNAGGSPHTISETGAMVPSKILDSVLDAIFSNIPGGGVIKSILTVPAPELRECNPSLPHPLDPDNDGMLWLGYLDTEAVHPDRLHYVDSSGVEYKDHIGGGGPNNDVGHVCVNNICSFKYNVPNDPNYIYPYAINAGPSGKINAADPSTGGHTDDCD